MPGTIYTAAQEIEEQGGKALPIICDIRSEEQVIDAIKQTVEKFGGIDILVNNASAISLTDTPSTTVKKYDLMHAVNGRGSWMVAKVRAGGQWAYPRTWTLAWTDNVLL